MIRYHTLSLVTIAEILQGSDLISGPDDILDIMADVGYHDCNRIIIYDTCLHQDFFNLKTGLAGEILQKFSNYGMRLSIIGDFSKIRSKSLNDFIREKQERNNMFC